MTWDQNLSRYHYTPAPPKVEWGYTWFTPMSVRPSVRPSVRLKTRFPDLFEKTIGWIHFMPGIYPYGVSLLTLFIFMFLASYLALSWPNIWPKMGFLELFEKIIGSIHFIPVIYPYGVSCLTPIHFRVPSLIFGPLVAKLLAENGVSGTFWKKTSGLIHFIPGIYPCGVSFFNSIHFRVPSLIFGPLVTKYLAENGVSRTFWKNYWLN